MVLAAAGIAAVVVSALWLIKREGRGVQRLVTFNGDIAVIGHQHCAPCHRPGQAGPFDLLTFADFKKHAADVAEVTAKRIMPPWLPEHGYGEFVGERRLSEREIGLIQRWVADGAPEGDGPAPVSPKFSNEWQLGAPDLVVEPGVFTLPPEGKDIYFNFVAPIPAKENKFVAGVELLPGGRVAHHAFINVDETGTSRRRAAKHQPPGFYGMEFGETVTMPGGQLLGWQPGKVAGLAREGLSWVLRTNTDLVLQMHMNPSGKEEKVRPRLGFYFTNQPPAKKAFRVRLTTLELDIPAGASNYVAESVYTLPVDVRMARVGAHAHYLGKDLQGFATLPSGEKKWLLWIKDWNFQWQGDYEYKEPVFLPKGSKLTMRFTYDNRSNNPRNPHNPPKRIFWGPNTTDEMGELYFQAILANDSDYLSLGRDYTMFFARESLKYYRFRIGIDPNDGQWHQRLGRALAQFGETAEAIKHLLEAIRLNPNDDQAHFDLGSIYVRQGRTQEAFNEFATVVRLNPEDSQALGSLGILCAQAGKTDEARGYFEWALRINPEDALAAKYLERLGSR